MVTFQTKLLICGAREEEGKNEWDREEGEDRGDDGSDCNMPHTLEAQSPMETVAVLDRCMTVQQ